MDATNNVEYTWAQNNLLTEVTSQKGSVPLTVSYAYGADNLLQTRTEGGSPEQFVWDTSRAIPAMLSDGKYEYVYSQDRVPLAQIAIATGNVTYLHKDLTGSVTASTDSSGQLMGTVDYSPYGVATGSLLSRFGYAGEWVDTVTGYSYLRARWLDTETGTFLSEDPLVQMTNNAFGCTEGDPITQIDPLGLSVWDDLRQSDGYKIFDKVNWTNVANTVGAVAIGVTIGALIVGTGGIAAPVIGAVLFSATVASAVTATAAAGQTCVNDKSFETHLTSDCSWGIAGAALSILPLAAKGSKLTKLAETKVPDRIPNDPGAVEALNAKVALAKFGQGAMDLSAGAAERLE